jgi:hypothetical protein
LDLWFVATCESIAWYGRLQCRYLCRPLMALVAFHVALPTTLASVVVLTLACLLASDSLIRGLTWDKFAVLIYSYL